MPLNTQTNDSNKANDTVIQLALIDTANSLTVEELQELKKLANLSKTARIFVGIGFGVIAMIGFPQAFTWLTKHIAVL